LITGGGKQERGDGEDDDRLEGGGGMELMGGHRRRSTPTSDPYYVWSQHIAAVGVRLCLYREKDGGFMLICWRERC